MDPVRAASMSDPEQNPWFRRRWVEQETQPPPAASVLDRVQTTPEQIRQQLLETWRQKRVSGQKGKPT